MREEEGRKKGEEKRRGDFLQSMLHVLRDDDNVKSRREEGKRKEGVVTSLSGENAKGGKEKGKKGEKERPFLRRNFGISSCKIRVGGREKGKTEGGGGFFLVRRSRGKEKIKNTLSPC